MEDSDWPFWVMPLLRDWQNHQVGKGASEKEKKPEPVLGKLQMAARRLYEQRSALVRDGL